MLGEIEIFQGLIESNPSLLTADLANVVNNFINDQLKLVNGNSTIDPELLKLLDLGIFVSK